MRSDLHATFGGKPLPVPLTGACPQKHSTLLSAPLLTDIMKFYFQIIPFSAGLSSDIVTEKTIIFLCDTNKFQPEIWHFSRKETGGDMDLQKRGKGGVLGWKRRAAQTPPSSGCRKSRRLFSTACNNAVIFVPLCGTKILASLHARLAEQGLARHLIRFEVGFAPSSSPCESVG